DVPVSSATARVLAYRLTNNVYLFIFRGNHFVVSPFGRSRGAPVPSLTVAAKVGGGGGGIPSSIAAAVAVVVVRAAAFPGCERRTAVTPSLELAASAGRLAGGGESTHPPDKLYSRSSLLAVVSLSSSKRSAALPLPYTTEAGTFEDSASDALLPPPGRGRRRAAREAREAPTRAVRGPRPPPLRPAA
ncbi:unnamed protein product, partial [Ectocarpus sp. 8 AP-2014]